MKHDYDIKKLQDRLTFAAALMPEVERHLHTAGVHVAAADPLAVALNAIDAQAKALSTSLSEIQNHLSHRILFAEQAS